MVLLASIYIQGYVASYVYVPSLRVLTRAHCACTSARFPAGQKFTESESYTTEIGIELCITHKSTTRACTVIGIAPLYMIHAVMCPRSGRHSYWQHNIIIM